MKSYSQPVNLWRLSQTKAISTDALTCMGYMPNAPQTNTGPQTQGAGAGGSIMDPPFFFNGGSPMYLVIYQPSLSTSPLHLLQPPRGRGPCKEGVQHTRPCGSGQAVTVAWSRCPHGVTWGAARQERSHYARGMENVLTCLPQASEWEEEPVGSHRLFAGRARGSVQATVPGEGQVAQVQASATTGNGDILEEDGNTWKWWAVVQ